MSRLYGRAATVTVARATPLLPLKVGTPLRIQFKIEKQPLTPPNTADISITNLSADSRRDLQQFGADVELRAGYASESKTLPLLFKGQARTVDSVRRGADWVTRIQCGDGEIPYRFANVNRSFGPGTRSADIVRAMAQVLATAGVDVAAFLRQLDDDRFAFPFDQFVFGYATQGNALLEIDKLLAPGNYLTSIQNGELRVLHGDFPSVKDAVLLSPSTGLLGSPEHGTPDRNGLPSILKVKALLRPQLEPGDPFLLAGVQNKGTFRAERVSHTGDTHGPDWTTELEARPITREASAFDVPGMLGET